MRGMLRELFVRDECRRLGRVILLVGVDIAAMVFIFWLCGSESVNGARGMVGFLVL